MNTPEEYPPPSRPRASCWVYSPRTRSRVVSIARMRYDPKIYRVVDTEVERIVFRGPWRDCLAFAAGELEAPFMNQGRTEITG